MSTGKRSKNSRLEKLFGKASRRDAFNRRLRCEFLESRHLLSATTISLTTGLSTFLENASNASSGGNHATYATVTLSEAATTDTTVNLSALNLTGGNDEAKIVDADHNVITSLVIAAGDTTATFYIDAVDDSNFDQSQTIRITAKATGCTSGIKDLTVTDDESTLDVTLNSSSISEAAGTKAVTGKVSITQALSTDLTITLAITGGSSRLSASTSTVTIYAGDTEATFTLNATDNTTYEGTETATVRATATGWVTDKATISVTDNELPGLTVALSPTSIAENATNTVTGTIYRQGSTSGELIVTVTISDTNEARFKKIDGTYTNKITVTIADGATSADFDIYAHDDDTVDGTQSVIITAEATNYTTDTATLSVTDDDVAKTLAISLSSSSVIESKGQFTGTITRTGSTTDELKVTITSSDTSEIGLFYDEDTGTYTDSIVVTIEAGQTSADFPIYVINDTIVDGTQSVKLTAKATDFTDATASVSVTDDDVAKTLSVSLSSSSVVETKGKFTGTVTRTGSTDTAIQVTITSTDLSEAAFKKDDGTYTDTITVTIGIGQTSADFDIYAIDDSAVDGTKTVTIKAEYSEYTTGTASLSVTDDDVAKTIAIELNPSSISEKGGTTTGTITLSQAATADMIITLTTDDATEAVLATTTVTITKGSTTGTFTINAADDSIVDGTQSVVITAADSSNLNYTAGTATLKVTDDDVAKTLSIDIDPSSISENGGVATGVVTRTGSTVGDLIVTFTTSDALEATVTQTVTIKDGETFATFTITGVDDNTYDGDQSVKITATATGYTSATDTITVTDVDVDTPLTVSIANVSANENAGSNAFTFVVTLSKTYSYAVTVYYATSNGTATAGTDYKAKSGKVTIAAGDTTAKIVIPVYGDSDVELNETFYVTLSNPTYASLGTSKATGTIKNDDKSVATTIGLYNASTGTAYLRYNNKTGAADASFTYAAVESDWVAIAGDWDGDGTDTLGYYDPTTSTFYLLDSNSATATATMVSFGTDGCGWTPIAGDWNGDGIETIGLYNTKTSTFYLRNSNTDGSANLTFKFGTANKGYKAIVGDWNGDGIDTIGVYNPTTSTFYLRNANSAGATNKTFKFGTSKCGWTPIAGDWNGDGVDTIGLYAASAKKFYLRNTNTAGAANLTLAISGAGSGWKPIIGHWTSSGSSLLASGGALTSSKAASLTQAQLNSVIKAAIARLADALNLDAAAVKKLESTQFVISNLTGSSLGLADGNTVYIDANAAGYGWFVDSTAGTDEEFRTTSSGSSSAISSKAVDKIDLLTVVEHELGHVLGLDDLDAALVNELMARTLGTGVRRSAASISALDLALAGY